MITRATQDQISVLKQIADANDDVKNDDYYDILAQKQRDETLDVFLYETLGYCILNYRPKYKYYALNAMPEIQDLIVIPGARRQGIGRKLLIHCEQTAREKGYTTIGVSVGLDATYGPAQRLYAKHGYIPDGYGVTYDRLPVQYAEIRPIDDNLCLMLEKTL